MNSFEQLVAFLLNQEGFWTLIDYKVNLSKDEKKEIGKSSMPRPEIDILAYKPNENTLYWVECKSYLDSGGVRITDLFLSAENANNRFKVFTLPKYRKIISEALIRQVVAQGLAVDNPKIYYCLVAGNIFKGEKSRVKAHFDENGWLLFDNEWIKEKLKRVSKIGYEDNIAVIVSKIISI